MSLLEEVKDYYANTGHPSPPIYDDIEGAELVGETALDSLRWGTLTEWVLRKDNEYVAIKDVRPATENQDWGDYGEPTIYEVQPIEKVVLIYIPV